MSEGEIEMKTKELVRVFSLLLKLEELIGERAWRFYEELITEKRALWLQENRKNYASIDSQLERAFKAFYEGKLGLNLKRDCELIEASEKRIIARWRNPCPVLEACKALGLDTKKVCKLCYEGPARAFMKRIAPNVFFSRNYSHLRPRANSCEEVLELVSQAEWMERFLKEESINGELIKTGEVKSVEQAAREVGCERSEIIKSLVLVDEKSLPVVFIVRGDCKLDLSKARQIAGVVRFASPSEVLELTGFEVGGVPPLGHYCRLYVDAKVLEKESVYGGGGDSEHLLKLSTNEFKRFNARFVEVAK